MGIDMYDGFEKTESLPTESTPDSHEKDIVDLDKKMTIELGGTNVNFNSPTETYNYFKAFEIKEGFTAEQLVGVLNQKMKGEYLTTQKLLSTYTQGVEHTLIRNRGNTDSKEFTIAMETVQKLGGFQGNQKWVQGFVAEYLDRFFDQEIIGTISGIDSFSVPEKNKFFQELLSLNDDVYNFVLEVDRRIESGTL